MAASRGGLKKVKVAILPAPPGWPRGFWAIFHAPQTIEEDHDPVYRLVADRWGFQIGPEIPEDDLGGWRIRSQTYHATLTPSESKVAVDVRLKLHGGSLRAPIFRLNDNFEISEPVVTATDTYIPHPSKGQVVRAGSLLIPWTSRPSKSLRFRYEAVLPRSNEDEITDKDAFVTAWWLPSLGRLPFTVESKITAPAFWKIRAEGFQISQVSNGVVQTSCFSCRLPISFPKIIAGRYKDMASAVVDGDQFHVFQLEPRDQSRANRDLLAMERAAAFYRVNLERLPFHGYECYDADRYYGIESYSHTLLQRNVTHFISHEMGHTYFGGIVPCPYVNDSWNEGLTEYIDSVVLLDNADHSLERGFRSINIDVPLSRMPVPWNYEDASYYRGCYVMKMLEWEIGSDKVMAALKSLVHDRVGRDTRWDDLRSYFERAGGENLGWFWRQWVDAAEFPTLDCWAESHPTAAGWTIQVKIAQSGTAAPFRIRALIRATEGGRPREQQVLLTSSTATFKLKTETKPEKVQVLAFPFTLARVRMN